MSSFEAVLAQYEKNKQSASGNQSKVSSEDRLKKFFTTLLPKGVTSAERRIRILPTPDGSSPFKEAFFHEIQVDGKWVKLYDPKQDGKRSPLNEVKESLELTGVESDKELSKSYRARKFYIVKLIDREAENDGVKFWRFKHNSKGEGILDKIFPIFKNKGDITDPEKGRDLILSLTLTKSGNGKEYTTVNSVIPEDIGPLHTDNDIAKSWIEDTLVWSDVYAKKPEEYLVMIANGEVPKWDNDLKKFVSSSTSEDHISGTSSSDVGTTELSSDPQDVEDVDDDLPF